MAVHIPIWPGSGSAVSGSTPFGIFDKDRNFQKDAPKVAVWCARRLGYPLTDVELQDINFYTAFEESISEYSNQVNAHSAKDNILGLMGINTGSLRLEKEAVTNSIAGVLEVSAEYGTEIGVGGRTTYYTGSLLVKEGKQIYSLLDTSRVTLESGNPSTDKFVIRKMIHNAPPAIVKYFDPFVGTGLGSQNLLDQFGFGNFSPGVNFLLMPMHHDILRMQAIEFNDQIRKSAYGFEIINNRIRIFPTPVNDYRIWFEYTLDSEYKNLGKGGSGKINSHATIPYFTLPYSSINDIGKQWIKKYTLVLSKEMLAYVRGKYKTLPGLEEEIVLNTEDLMYSVNEEKQRLIDVLRIELDQFSRQSQLERKMAESEAHEKFLAVIPLKIYVG
jgi:hypothetical protein